MKKKVENPTVNGSKSHSESNQSFYFLPAKATQWIFVCVSNSEDTENWRITNVDNIQEKYQFIKFYKKWSPPLLSDNHVEVELSWHF